MTFTLKKMEKLYKKSKKYKDSEFNLVVYNPIFIEELKKEIENMKDLRKRFRDKCFELFTSPERLSMQLDELEEFVVKVYKDAPREASKDLEKRIKALEDNVFHKE